MNEESKEKDARTKVLTIPKNMNFGIEIESDGPNISKVLRESFFKNLKWKSTTDNGLSEVISPILYGGNEYNTNQIYEVCEKLQELGQYSSLKGGAHVHISNGYLKSIAAIQNFIDIWANCEKILFCISNPPGEITRPDGVYYAYPISEMLYQNYNELIRDDSKDYSEREKYLEETIMQANKYDKLASLDTHCRAVNLYTLHHTFEFRLANSSVNPEIWIENINLFGGIIKATQEVTDIQNKPKEERTQEERLKLSYLYKVNDSGISDEERLEALLSLVVSEKQKDIYRERYSKNIAVLKQNKEFEKTLVSKIAFAKIHYNQTSYREGMELDGLESIKEVQHRVEKLIREYIMVKHSSYEHDAKFLETNFQQIEQFANAYISLRNMGLEQELYEGLDFRTLNYDEFRNKTIDLLKQKQNEMVEKRKQEEQNRQTKESILNKSKTISQRIITLYNRLKKEELNTTNIAKKLGIEFSIYGIDEWELPKVINNINTNIGLISNHAQNTEVLSANSKTLAMLNEIESLTTNVDLGEEYSRELRETFEQGFNDRIQELIKKSKIARLNIEQQLVESEKVSFIERILGKVKLQKAKLENIELRKKIENSKEKSKKISLEDSLADLYVYIKTELGNVPTPQIKEFLERVNNEPYLMQNINIKNMKSKIEKKIERTMQDEKKEIVLTKGGLLKYRSQTMLLESENKRLQADIEEKTTTSQNKSSFSKIGGTIQRIKKLLTQVECMTEQEIKEETKINEPDLRESKEL